MKKTILVTGGTGYVASWLIKYLLEDGHKVYTTVRDLSKKEKYDHLTQFNEKYPGDLLIYEANLLEENSFEEAMKGCEIVIHTASPFFISGIKNPQKQLVEPALKGTRNVLETVNKTIEVKKVVLTSSIAAIMGDNNEIHDTENGIFTEEHWNKTSSLNHQPYQYSKTIAEKEAWKIAESQNRWRLTTINPGFVLGPSLTKRKDSTSIDFMLSLLNGQFKSGVPKLHFGIVDVRDVATAHINAALKPDAKGRHITVSDDLSILEIAHVLKKEFGDKYPIPKKELPKFMFYLVGPFMGFSWKFTRKNIGHKITFNNKYTRENLGMEFLPVEQTIVDHAKQVIEDGLLEQ